MFKDVISHPVIFISNLCRNIKNLVMEEIMEYNKNLRGIRTSRSQILCGHNAFLKYNDHQKKRTNSPPPPNTSSGSFNVNK